jgi:hypothetical protein
MLDKFAEWRVKRVALREAFGFEPVEYNMPKEAEYLYDFCGNPVYNYKNMQVTLWSVCCTIVDSYNYIASTGEVFLEYRLWDIMRGEQK